MEKIKSIGNFIWAIVAFIGAILAAIFLFKRNPDAVQVINGDNQLDNQQTQVDQQIQDIKDELDNINTAGMSDEDIADYFNKKR